MFRSLAEIPAGFGPSVAAVGNFDGVHLGHREILASVRAEARSTGARAVAVTFDPHPEQLSAPREGAEIAYADGPSACAFWPEPESTPCSCSRSILPLPVSSAREFVERILVSALGTRSVHEGRNFRFGHGARAGVRELGELGAEMGFTVHMHEAVRVRGMEISSSAVRAFIAAGDVRRARWMLGRPFAVASTPARGRGIGTRLLVPTVNLAPYDGLLPAFGVYITRLKIDGRVFQAVTNVGNRPTFGEASFAVESHILDFEPVDLNMHTPIELEFLLRLRGEQQWPSPQALKAQIFADVTRAKRYFRLLNSMTTSG